MQILYSISSKHSNNRNIIKIQETYMLVNGYQGWDMEEVNSILQMDPIMKATGNLMKLMAEVD